ncbi:MAG: radical SAM protein [Elusimicrobiaceae bacterium]|nr:radical SAM protein [Elusimicrobiaceae bacterium]
MQDANSKHELILDGHKLAWHRDRVAAWLRGEPVAPVTIDCALTRACSYNCIYCYGKLQTNDCLAMTRDVIFRFLDDAAAIGVKAVSFVSDGESTCSPHLYDAITHGSAKGLDMALGTNGYLLREDRLEEILPRLTYLRFNMSGGEPARYREIMGCPPDGFERVCGVIKKCVEIKRRRSLPVTIGIQMVLMPRIADQILPLTKLGGELGADYFVIKHCSDDEQHTLGINYDAYYALEPVLKQAEAMSRADYLVRAKWSKIMSGGTRCYDRCYGPGMILQISGSGLVAPCGMLFNSKYAKYHIGNIAETPFSEIFHGARYREVLNSLADGGLDVHKNCGTLCLQHKVNEYLWHLKQGGAQPEPPDGSEPPHVNFV